MASAVQAPTKQEFVFSASGNVLFDGRVVAVRARRKGDTPLLIVCVYGHSANAGQAGQLQYDVFLELTRMGEDHVTLGDWNSQLNEHPWIRSLLVGW